MWDVSTYSLDLWHLLHRLSAAVLCEIFGICCEDQLGLTTGEGPSMMCLRIPELHVFVDSDGMLSTLSRSAHHKRRLVSICYFQNTASSMGPLLTCWETTGHVHVQTFQTVLQNRRLEQQACTALASRSATRHGQQLSRLLSCPLTPSAKRRLAGCDRWSVSFCAAASSSSETAASESDLSIGHQRPWQTPSAKL